MRYSTLVYVKAVSPLARRCTVCGMTGEVHALHCCLALAGTVAKKQNPTATVRPRGCTGLAAALPALVVRVCRVPHVMWAARGLCPPPQDARLRAAYLEVPRPRLAKLVAVRRARAERGAEIPRCRRPLMARS